MSIIEKCRKYRKCSFGRRKSFNIFISLKKFLPIEIENYTNNKEENLKDFEFINQLAAV